MSEIDDRINSLSPEELDMLNSDPQMLQQFKTKYSAPTPMMDTAKEAVKAALPSPSFDQPIQTTASSPAIAGAQAAVQTLRDPTRLLPTIEQPTKLIGETVPPLLEAQGVPSAAASVEGFVQAIKNDPATYLGIEGPALPKGVQKQLSKLGEVLSGVDKENFLTLANRTGEVLKSAPSSETGAAFQTAKELAGVTDAEERALALSEGAQKRTYKKVLEKIDQATTIPPSQQETLFARDLREGWARLSGENLQPETRDLASRLQKGNYIEPTSFQAPSVTPKPDVSLADLLMAKKAGQKIIERDPSASGLIQKEIHTKINPLLKEKAVEAWNALPPEKQALAPNVYDAQQAVHLSKVKESFMNLFPQGKGMMNYFRTISMLAGSMFHGIGALESPMVAGAATLLGSHASKLALSSGGASAALRAAQGFTPADINPQNGSQLQSVRDRLRNAQ